MLIRRIVAVLTLGAFLPAALGCAERVTVHVDSDFTRIPSVNQAHDPTRIAGYTTSIGEHDWKGWVRATSIDSLEFFRGSPQGAMKGRKPESFKLARADVSALEMLKEGDNTALLVVSLATLSILASVALITITEDDTDY